VEQGRQFRRGSQVPHSVIGEAALQEARAWRGGKLIFTARPLHTVVAEINRYRRGEVLLLASDAGDQPVSGIFSIYQLDNAIAVIADTLSLKTIRIGTLFRMLY
jgi:transmembrane sensor